MARRRKGSSGGLAAVILGAIVFAIAPIPKDMWIGIDIVAAIALVVWLTSESEATPESLTPCEVVEEVVHFEPPRRSSTQRARAQGLKERAIPPRCIPAPETVEVGGTTISSGVLHLGSGLGAASADLDPALIDPAGPPRARTPTLASGRGQRVAGARP